MNPGQSVKDRPARQIILEAEKRGEIGPGGLVVEATAGNTGIGLALVANARGYRTIIVIPETQSQEKKDALRLIGAELIEVPAVPYANANNYQHVGRRLAEGLRRTETNGVLFADQWNNLDNRKAHYLSTGPEIWEETNGKVDGFICSIGTGGTVAGTSHVPAREEEGHRHRCRRSQGRRHVQSVRAWRSQGDRGRLDHRRHRARPRHQHHRGHQGRSRLSHSRRGGGADHLRPAQHEGLCMGGSTGINVAGAIRLAKEMGPGHTIVTVLADYGTRYQSKLFNPEFLRSKNLPVPAWLTRRSQLTIPFEKS